MKLRDILIRTLIVIGLLFHCGPAFGYYDDIRLFLEFVSGGHSKDISPGTLKILHIDKDRMPMVPVGLALVETALRFPESREEIETVYRRYLGNMVLHFSRDDSGHMVRCSAGIAGDREDKEGALSHSTEDIQIEIIRDIDETPHVFRFSLDGTPGDNVVDRLSIQIPGSMPGARAKVKVNGVDGILKGMTVSGDNRLSIFSIDRGKIHEFGYSGILRYDGISRDGKTIFFEYKNFRFFHDLGSGKIIDIKPIDPFTESRTIGRARAELAGLKYASIITSGGKTWAITDRPSRTTLNINDLYILKTPGNRFEKICSFLTRQDNWHCGGSQLGCYQYIMDGKLFISKSDYDAYERFQAIDLKTGLKLFSEPGGWIAPVGPHELYYSGYERELSLDDGDERGKTFLLDTRTMKRSEIPIPVREFKASAIKPHPKPGYFIGITWTIL